MCEYIDVYSWRLRYKLEVSHDMRGTRQDRATIYAWTASRDRIDLGGSEVINFCVICLLANFAQLHINCRKCTPRCKYMTLSEENPAMTQFEVASKSIIIRLALISLTLLS